MATPSVAARIQSHPSRRDLRRRLFEGLVDIPTEVIEDEVHPWSGYRKCLQDPPDCTHLLIVQDDAVPCKNLAVGLKAIASAEPKHPLCLFLGMLPMRTKRDALLAGQKGSRFVDIHRSDFMPVVAVLWPLEKAAEFLAWADAHPRGYRRDLDLDQSDDAMGGRWMRSTRNRVLATVPSLFQHYDDVPSTIARKPGGRTAMFWHGESWDCASVEWGNQAQRV